MEAQDLPQEVRRALNRSRVSQSAVARALSLPRSSVNARWHGRRDWRLRELERLANRGYLSITIDKGEPHK